MTGYKWNAYILFFLLDNSFPFTYTFNENDYQYNKNAKENNMRKNKKIDVLLIVMLFIMAVSGFAIPFFRELLWITIVHKMASVLFCILCTMHVLQYKKGKGGKKNVS